jgi:hypothetical protein
MPGWWDNIKMSVAKAWTDFICFMIGTLKIIRYRIFGEMSQPCVSDIF